MERTRLLEELTQGSTYQINMYSYSDLLSTTSINTSILLDGKSIQLEIFFFISSFILVPLLKSFDVQPLDSTSVQLTWSLSDSSITDNYTLSITRLCDNIEFPLIT